MSLILIAITVILLGGGAAFSSRSNPRRANGIGVGSVIAGSIIGLAGAIPVLVSPDHVESIRLAWSVPYGSFYLEADTLSAFFLLPIFLLTGLCALYGGRYLWAPEYFERLGTHWAIYSVLAVSMVMVVIARNAVLFLFAWEMMALSSYFLVTTDNERDSVQRAGWTYLTATHLGTTALFFLFIMMGATAGSLDFDRIAASGTALQPQASLFFILALIGFGTKTGIVPLHVWLPEAHPAAPSHISALMSGVMIKTGIYGIIRTLMWLTPPPIGWAVTVIVIGCASGVLGVLVALAQHDLKRLLAYHSVENIGIIFLGLGIGVLGQASATPALIVLGYGGALLHTLNHAIFKGLLFLGAGSIQHSAHTLNLERMGGLMRRMPWTGALFLIGAAAISGLPPFNGFISEFLIYNGAFQGITSLGSWSAVPALLAIIALALIGGLAVACFTKATGVAFLGEPRSLEAGMAHESKREMIVPMVILASLCLLVGLSAPLILTVLKPVLATVANISSTAVSVPLDQSADSTMMIAGIGLTFITFIGLLAWVRSKRHAKHAVVETVTWDCGYSAPNARMQYTASSFAQPLMDIAGGLIGVKEHLHKPEGFFPRSGSFSSHAPDRFTEGMWRPLFAGGEWLLKRFRWMQAGSIHLYVLYIAITLLFLLLTMLG